MKRQFLNLTIIFIISFLVYFSVGTKWTFRVPLDLDHFNPLASAFLQGRLDIPQPATTNDLSYYQGRWYPYWGLLPALLLIPAQLLIGRFVPLFYLNILVGSLNVVIIYLFLKRLQKEFLPQLSNLGVFLVTILFAFGTTHFYLSVNCGVWHVAQIVSFLPTSLGIYFIFKKKRQLRDYFIASFLISLSFFGRLSMIFLLIIPLWLALTEEKMRRKNLAAIIGPASFFLILFCFYNYLRFKNPLETGYTYVIYHPHFLPAIKKHGLYSLAHWQKNLWFMILEIPKLIWQNGFKLRFNLEGSSIFFLTPPLLTIFLAKPLSPYLKSLWLALILILIPILSIYTTGWIQFGYRFSLDFMIPLLLLSVFGIKGKMNPFYILGIAFAIWMQFLGITALQ